MKEVIAIFIGSGFGGVSRYILSMWLENWHKYSFPFGTLVINIIACLVLGFVIGVADNRGIISPTVRLFLSVGFCGGFSTFSTFSNETIGLFQQGNVVGSAIYIISSIILCISATLGGLYIADNY